MPRFPALSSPSSRLQPAVFTRLLPLLQQLPTPPLPLHIGDTFLAPPPAARLDRVAADDDRALYPYSSPAGDPALRAAFCQRWTDLGLRGLEPERVHVTVGATGAVQAAMRTFAGVGDEVLLLAPFWPLVRGIVLSTGATPVEVPFYDRIRAGQGSPAERITAALEAHLSERTTTVYLTSPNNPDGTVLSAEEQQGVADFCLRHDLWLISDEAYCVIGQKQLSGVAHVQIEDTSLPGSFFRLVGAQNLDAFYSDLLNPSWETGNVSGWLKSGDGRVVAKLGSTVPVGGKFMGVLSTGLGYTKATGELKQRFCVQPGRKTLSFWWKLYSEEFKEFCGSTFQDSFSAELVAAEGKKTIVKVKVDDLCPKGCTKGKAGCGAQYKGLDKADVSFDKGGVYMTPWVQATVNVGPFAGNGNVNLRLFATDVGDSVYDTAILVDKIDIQ